jgi:hypothetical protein
LEIVNAYTAVVTTTTTTKTKTTKTQTTKTQTTKTQTSSKMLAVLPMCSTYVVLISSQYFKDAHGIFGNSEKMICTNDAEVHFAKNVIPFVVSKGELNIERVPSRDAQVQALMSSTSSSSTIVCAMGTLTELHTWFGKLKNKMLADYGDDIDAGRLAHIMPWARSQVIDASNIMEVHAGAPQRLFRVITLDHVLMTSSLKDVNLDMSDSVYNKGIGKGVASILDSVFTNNDILAATTFYTQHMEERFAPLTIDRIREASRRIVAKGSLESNDVEVGRSSRSILEQFRGDDREGPSLTVEPPSNVKGFLEFRQTNRVTRKTFTMPSSEIMPRVFLKPGDRVQLAHQARSDENGMYVAVTSTTLVSDPVRDDDDVDHQETKMNVMNRPVKPRDGACITESRIMNKVHCESAYDAFGREKPSGPDIWDKPCEKNTDCPFFQANKTYPNYRGGCINGYCELPLGLKRASYRKYYDSPESFPLCHGCPGGSGDDGTATSEKQRNCCTSQGINPNYAFELDAYERLYALRHSKSS